MHKMASKYQVWEAFAAENPYPRRSPSVECCELVPGIWVYRQQTKGVAGPIAAIRFMKQNLIFWMHWICPDKDFIRTNYLNSPCHFVRTYRIGQLFGGNGRSNPYRDPTPWLMGLGGELTLEAFNKALADAPIQRNYRGDQYSFWIAQHKNQSDLYERVAELTMLIRFLGWDKNEKLVYSIREAIRLGVYQYVDPPGGAPTDGEGI